MNNPTIETPTRYSTSAIVNALNREVESLKARIDAIEVVAEDLHFHAEMMADCVESNTDDGEMIGEKQKLRKSMDAFWRVYTNNPGFNKPNTTL